MKKIVFIVICFIASGFVACENNLTEVPLSFLGESNSFESADDAHAAIGAVYHRLRGVYGMTMIDLADLNGDECEGRADFAFGSELHDNLYSSSTEIFNTFYVNSYVLIDRANRILENVPGIEMDEQEKKGILAEARFLRALAYFNLVRAFGEVPLIDHTASDLVNVHIPRSSVADIYGLVVADLTAAETDLPLTYTESDQIGRATRGAAMALLAKVYLTNGEWQQAATKAKAVIDLGIYDLFTDYRDVFVPEEKNGIEHIFSVQYSCLLPRYGSPMAENFAIWFSYPINRGGGAYQVTPRHADSYLAGDYRKEVTVIYEKERTDGELVVSRTGPHMDKYWDPMPCGSRAARNNFPVLRYADVLLMYAEALNELNGPTADAYEAINKVRERARNGNPDSELVNLEGVSQSEFRDAVLQERSWELCFEGHRRWDMLRTGTYLARKTAEGVTTQEKHLLYPLPVAQLDVNTALEQNPGW